MSSLATASYKTLDSLRSKLRFLFPLALTFARTKRRPIADPVPFDRRLKMMMLRESVEKSNPNRPFLHLRRDLGLGVRDLDAKLLRPSDDVDTLS